VYAVHGVPGLALGPVGDQGQSEYEKRGLPRSGVPYNPGVNNQGGKGSIVPRESPRYNPGFNPNTGYNLGYDNSNFNAGFDNSGYPGNNVGHVGYQPEGDMDRGVGMFIFIYV
jgi:hypothetical protein